MAHHVDFTIRPKSAAGRSGHNPSDRSVANDPLRASAAKVFCVARFLLDQLVGGCEERFRHLDAERLGGLQVDDEVQRSCVFKGLPLQTILKAIIEP